MHGAIAGTGPADPSLADRPARQLLALGDQFHDHLARRPQPPPQHEYALDRVPHLLVRAQHDADRRRGRARPASPRPPRRSASCMTNTNNGSPANAWRWSAPSSRLTARAASSMPASPSTGSSPAPSNARLARDLPRVWNAPTTTDRDRKEL